MSGARKWFFRLVAAFVVPLLMLSAIEGTLRLAGYGYPTAFLSKLRIGQSDFLVNSETFAYRFFPPEVARFPGPIRISDPKPPGVYRIFLLGESAAMGDPEPAYGAGRYLEALLAERFPDQKFEVINVAITAINSHTILPIARECARHQGDLWLIYMGNNEMVGPFGAATVFGAKAPPLWLARLNLAAQKLRLGQALAGLARHLKGKASQPSSWGGMEMFLGNQLAPDAPAKERVYHNFEGNLRDILRCGLDSGAEVILSTVAVNLKDCPPFASVSSLGLAPEQLRQRDQLYAEGRAAQQKGNFPAALEQFQAAVQLDPLSAELAFHCGQCLLGLTNWTAARQQFQRACDQDALPFRADSRINELIRTASSQLKHPRLHLLDAANALSEQAPEGMCGQETFYEHVHFNFEGNYRLARAWAAQIEPVLARNNISSASSLTSSWPSLETCNRRLGLWDWNRSFVLQAVLRRLQQPPLSTQEDNQQRSQSFQEQERAIEKRLNATTAEQVRGEFNQAIGKAPQDHFLRENFADFLEAVRDVKQACEEWQRVHELLPVDFLAQFQIGRLLAKQGQLSQAEAALKQSLVLRPQLAEAWHELGNLHVAQAKFEIAVEDFDHAWRLRPRDAVFCSYKAKALSKLNRHQEAVELFRKALDLNPNYWEARLAFANELMANKNLSEARDQFEELIRRQPRSTLARLNYGALLAGQGKTAEARGQFEEVLRLEPANRLALDSLERLQDKGKPGQKL